jgi:DNA polymerase III delta prime subunit
MISNRKESQILKFIKEKSTEEHSVTMNDLLDASKLDNNVLAMNVFSLYTKQKVEITIKKTDKIEIIITSKKIEVEKKLPKYHLLGELFHSIEICSRLFTIENIEQFHQFTHQKFKELALVQFLELCNSEFINLKIICSYLTQFFSGDNCIRFTDLGLNNEEVINFLDQNYNDTFLLKQQELVSLKKEHSSIFFEDIISPRLLRLVKNEMVPVIRLSEKNNKGLYFEINHDHIKPCTLYYNQLEQDLYNNISRLLYSNKNLSDSNISILLYGKPGTGKTEFTYQIAKEIQADVMQLNLSEIHSKWIGDTEKNIRLAFEAYSKKQNESNRPTILLINEADGLMNRRVSVTASNDAYHNQSQTELLELLEDFKGIVIATTNLYQNIDEAFHRRFLFRYEISAPNRATRELILNKSLVSKCISEKLSQKIIDSEWCPAQLKNIERKIKQLEVIQKMDDGAVENLFLQDGLFQQKRKLGFL